MCASDFESGTHISSCGDVVLRKTDILRKTDKTLRRGALIGCVESSLALEGGQGDCELYICLTEYICLTPCLIPVLFPVLLLVFLYIHTKIGYN